VLKIVDLMNSEDYKDRFAAEYYQLKIRMEKLDRLISRYRAGTLDFTPTCPIELLEEQYKAMAWYFEILQKRAEIEGVSIG
jgi:hypothetical protein